MAVVAMAFPAQDVDAGSGLLVPPVTGRLVKGVTVSSAKWPHLGGDDVLLVRPSVGRFRGEAELQRPDDDLTAAVVADVADLLGPGAAASRWTPGWSAGAGDCRSTWSATSTGSTPSGRRSARCRGWRSPGRPTGASASPCVRDALHAVDALL